MLMKHRPTPQRAFALLADHHRLWSKHSMADLVPHQLLKHHPLVQSEEILFGGCMLERRKKLCVTVAAVKHRDKEGPEAVERVK